MRWNAYLHRLYLGSYSHPKDFLGNGVRTHVNSKGKIPSTGKILPRGGWNPRHCIKQHSQPNTLPTSYSGPHQAGQPAQHTTNELFRPPSSRTASPSHYQRAIPSPGQPAQHTTNELFRPPSSRTASPTHYQLSYSVPRTASPTHYQLSYSGPRTANPTHYQLSYSGPPDPRFNSRFLRRDFSGRVMSVCDRLVGLVVKVSASRAKDPGLSPKRGCFRVESFQ